MPIHDIAAVNKDIVDVDLVSEGKHLNIPSASAGDAQGVSCMLYFLIFCFPFTRLNLRHFIFLDCLSGYDLGTFIATLDTIIKDSVPCYCFRLGFLWLQ